MAQAVYDGSCSVGLGIVKSAKGFEVRTFVKYGPAELSKQIQVGDILLNINERSTTTMPLESLEAELMGPPDSTVRLTFVRHINGKSSSRVVLLTRNLPLSEKQYQALLQKRQEATHPSIENKFKLPLPKLGRQVIGEMIQKEATNDTFKKMDVRYIAIDIPSMTYMPRISWSTSKEQYDQGIFKGSINLVETATCQETKQPRGTLMCLRLDHLLPKLDAVEKYKASYPDQRWDVDKLVLGFETPQQREKWLAAFRWAMDAKNINMKHRAAQLAERNARNLVGLGVAVSTTDDGNFVIKDFAVNSPVHLSRCVLPKDIIVGIDGSSVNGLGFEEFEELVFGAIDSRITLTLRRSVNHQQVREFTVDLIRRKYGAEYVPLDVPHRSIENPFSFPLPIAGATIAVAPNIYSEALIKKDKMKTPEFARKRLALSINHNSFVPRLMWFEESDAEFKFPVAQVMLTSATCGETKNSREGFKHCLRIDMKLPSQSDVDALYAHDVGLTWGVDKVVLGFAEQTEYAKWLSALGWALKAQTVVENHVALKSGSAGAVTTSVVHVSASARVDTVTTPPVHTPAPAHTPVHTPAPAHIDMEAARRASLAQAMEEMEAEQQALAREQERNIELQRAAEAATARMEEEARRVAILQKLEEENREIQSRLLQDEANAKASSQPAAKVEVERDEAQRTHAVQSADSASTVEEAEMALARMEMSQPPPVAATPSAGKGRRSSVSVDEWTVQKSRLLSKIMCLRGGEVWKFARDKILKKKWHTPALKTLAAPGKGFILWTGRKPVRYTRASAGPSEALNFLISGTDPKTLMEAGVGGARHCMFHVDIISDDGSPDILDFAVNTPELVRQWVDGLTMLLHTVSVGIGLEVKITGGKFIVEFGKDGSPSGACGKFNHGDIIEAIDTSPLTERTTFAEYEALVLGPDDSPISVLLNRGGQKIEVKLRRGPTIPPK